MNCTGCEEVLSNQTIACEACQAKYCTKKCCDKHAVEHQVECNVHDVNHVDSLVALPFYFGAADKKGYHLVRTVMPNRTVITKIQPIRAELEPVAAASGAYSLTINGKTFTGRVEKDLISTDNRRNEIASQLATQRTSAVDTIWIPLEEPIEFEPSGLDIEFSLDNGELDQKIHVEMPTFSVEGDVDRSTKSFCQRQIKLKGLDPMKHSAKIVQNICLVVDNHTPPRLKDVEVILAEPESIQVNRQVFECDPLNLDQITGLVMAFEEYIPKCAPAEKETAERLFQTLNEHRSTLESRIKSNLAPESSPKVNAAVHSATDMLWQQVGGMVRRDRYYNKLRKDDQNLTWANSTADTLIEEYNTLSEQESNAKLLKKAYYKVRRMAKKADGNDLLSAVGRRLRETDQLSTSTKVELQNLQQKLQTTFSGSR